MSALAELPVLVGPGQDEPETLMLVSEPNAAGIVTVRRWTAADWSSVPSVETTLASSLHDWLEDARRNGRTMNQPLAQIRTWLHR